VAVSGATLSLASEAMRTRLRVALATTAAAGVLAYAVAGHGLPQTSSHEGMAGSTIGLCLLLVTVVGSVATIRPARPAQRLRPISLLAPEAAPAPEPLDARSRASPSTLQRFRN